MQSNNWALSLSSWLHLLPSPGNCFLISSFFKISSLSSFHEAPLARCYGFSDESANLSFSCFTLCYLLLDIPPAFELSRNTRGLFSNSHLRQEKIAPPKFSVSFKFTMKSHGDFNVIVLPRIFVHCMNCLLIHFFHCAFRMQVWAAVMTTDGHNLAQRLAAVDEESKILLNRLMEGSWMLQDSWVFKLSWSLVLAIEHIIFQSAGNSWIESVFR